MITIKDAIQLLQTEFETSIQFGEVDTAHALKLGIEALKRIQACRQVKLSNDYFTLPGEWKE